MNTTYSNFVRLKLPKRVELDAALQKALGPLARDLFENVRMNYFVLPVTSLPKVLRWQAKWPDMHWPARSCIEDSQGCFIFIGRARAEGLFGAFWRFPTLAVSCFRLTGGTTVFRLWAWDEHISKLHQQCVVDLNHQEWVDEKAQDMKPTESISIVYGTLLASNWIWWLQMSKTWPTSSAVDRLMCWLVTCHS